MTLKEAYEYGKEQLNTAGLSEAELDAWYLLEHITGVSRTQYFLCMDSEMKAEAFDGYQECIMKRMQHIPLQHLTGVQAFMGLEFLVNEHVLIPRQDTEVLVEAALSFLQPGMRILDMCTGSGCILISLLHYKKECVGTGVDLSGKALEVAVRNAKKQCIEVRLHDPMMALDGMEDGLYFYRKIIKNSRQYLKKNGGLYFEIGHDQGEAVKSLMEEAGFKDVAVKKDLAGLDRVVVGVYS